MLEFGNLNAYINHEVIPPFLKYIKPQNKKMKGICCFCLYKHHTSYVMNLSISNIAWKSEQDENVYRMMKNYGYSGLEIAPTKIFPENPYGDLNKAKLWVKSLKEREGFQISSMQSIWFGRTEKLFGTKEERNHLIDYTEKAIDFAAVIKCRNLVFGCPRNRIFTEDADPEDGITFFKEIGDYAYSKGTTIGMEANPTIYGTNYINDTISAIDLVKSINSKGFLLNLDVGTMIANAESADLLKGNIRLISHVHISEPYLKPLEKRDLHKELAKYLKEEDYKGFVSIEMGTQNNMKVLENCLIYIKEIF